MMDYSTEINKLFPKNSESGIYQPSNTNNIFSLFTQSGINHSSSTDSTSPGSISDTSIRQLYNEQYETLTTFSQSQQDWYESPAIRRRRIGRRLMTSDQTPTSEPLEFNQRTWLEALPSIDNYVDLRKSTNNVTYELFPVENKEADCKLRAILNTSPVPNASFSSNISPISSVAYAAPASFRRNSSPFAAQSISRPNSTNESNKMCTFCRKNGETPNVYLTHQVKEKIGNKTVVTCPILRSHVCHTCGASGDNAHTITYCPVLRNCNNGQPLQSTTITLKNTRIQSNGKRRY